MGSRIRNLISKWLEKMCLHITFSFPRAPKNKRSFYFKYSTTTLYNKYISKSLVKIRNTMQNKQKLLNIKNGEIAFKICHNGIWSHYYNSVFLTNKHLKFIYKLGGGLWTLFKVLLWINLQIFIMYSHPFCIRFMLQWKYQANDFDMESGMESWIIGS